MGNNLNEELKRQSAFSRALHSIRTRYSLATACFLLTIVSLFYIGGRIVLVHLIRDAEEQVRNIGMDIKTLAYRNAEKVRRRASTLVESARSGPLESALDGKSPAVTLALRLASDGSLVEGLAAEDGRNVAVSAEDLAPYLNKFPQWTSSAAATNETGSVGIMRVHGRSRYVAIFRDADGAVVLGTDFDSAGFTSQVNEGFSGMEVRVTDRKVEIHATEKRPRSPGGDRAKPQSFGIAPMLDEAIDFYSGGFWHLSSDPFETVFAIRDIAGNAVSMISVSLPKTLSSVTSVAVGRLAVFVTVAGMLLVLPVFWFQSRVILNPLSEMTRRIRDISIHRTDIDCPRIEWKSKDEFAQLALSVNAMLETISRRSIAIAQIETRQRALIDGLPDGLAIFDRIRHHLVTFTKEPDGVNRVPGFIPGSGPDPSVYGQAGVDAFNKALDAVYLHEGALQQVRLAAWEGGDRPRHFEIRLTRMDDHFALAIIRDVTDELREHLKRIAAESRLQRQQKQESLTALAGGIAHDVNNVLAVILNTAEITWMDTEDPNARAAVDTIRDAVKRGSSMARELMTFAGETKLSLKRSDPSDIVKEAQRLAKGIAATHGNVNVSYDLPPGLPAVDADPNQIWKVFFNLIKNAVEAIGDGPGEITVTTRKFELTAENAKEFNSMSPLKPGPGVLFQVSDTGPGIPPAVLRRVFDPYFSTKASGRGFGLATVSAIVSAHNGGIGVVSEISHGTTFRIFLPVSSIVGEVTRRLEIKNSGGTVLVIDDDPAILRTTGILLKALKFNCIAASTRAEALAAYRNHLDSLGCAILDANIAGADALQLLASMRQISPAVPVVVSSGSAAEKIARQFAEQPYDEFLGKPYTLAELQDVLSRVARKVG